ncbi:hypothetical protein ACHAWF_018354 [Thalassiosira exigua]
MPLHEQQQQQQQQQMQMPRDVPTQSNHAHQTRQDIHFRSMAQIYFVFSAMLAFLAVVTSPSNISLASNHARIGHDPREGKGTSDVEVDSSKGRPILEEGSTPDFYENVVFKKNEWEAVVAALSKAKPSFLPQSPKLQTPLPSPNYLNIWADIKEFFSQQQSVAAMTHSNIIPTPSHGPNTFDEKKSGSWWLLPWQWVKHNRANDNHNKADDDRKQSNASDKASSLSRIKFHSRISPILHNMIDPSLVELILSRGERAGDRGPVAHDSSPFMTPGQASSPTFKSLIDKVFTSTPRLIAIANLMLAVTYLLQTAVADVFLGASNDTSNSGGTDRNDPPRRLPINILDDPSIRWRRAGRERFWGFLLVKLLLISAVLEPDSFDLFILLSWYTILSLLRSLAHLAGSTANHASQSGESPSPGALHLLILVLFADGGAAAVCVLVFHKIGWNMLLLLTCDCILLGIDTIAHILRHAVSTIEEMHRIEISQLEDRQIEIFAQSRERFRDDEDNESSREPPIIEETGGGALSVEDNSDVLEEEMVQIDRAVEMGVDLHSRRMAMLDAVAFSLEMFALVLTVCHFLHIWALHGRTSFGSVFSVFVYSCDFFFATNLSVVMSASDSSMEYWHYICTQQYLRLEAKLLKGAILIESRVSSTTTFQMQAILTSAKPPL